MYTGSAQGKVGEKWGVNSNGIRSASGGDENVLILTVVMVPRLHKTVYFK